MPKMIPPPDFDVAVTPHYIAIGEPCFDAKCPIAKAVLDWLSKHMPDVGVLKVFVDGYHIRIVLKGNRVWIYHMDSQLSAWTSFFDEELYVCPMIVHFRSAQATMTETPEVK